MRKYPRKTEEEIKRAETLGAKWVRLVNEEIRLCLSRPTKVRTPKENNNDAG